MFLDFQLEVLIMIISNSIELEEAYPGARCFQGTIDDASAGVHEYSGNAAAFRFYDRVDSHISKLSVSRLHMYIYVCVLCVRCRSFSV